MKKAIAGIGLVLLLGGGLLIVAVSAVLAALFVDFDSLLGQNPSVSGADAGASAAGSHPGATTAAGSADADAGAGALPSSDTAATPTAAAGKTSSPATTTTTAATAQPSSGPTLGQACVSNADCTGAYERCGTGRVCECSTGGGWNQPRACGSRCVTNTDPENCGACGKRCANDEICTTSSGGSVEHPICIPCAKAGLGVTLLCGPHKCVAPNSDPRHCGGCNKKCTPGQSCVNGACQ